MHYKYCIVLSMNDLSNPRFAELAQVYRDKGCKLLVYPGAFNMTTGKPFVVCRLIFLLLTFAFFHECLILTFAEDKCKKRLKNDPKMMQKNIIFLIFF